MKIITFAMLKGGTGKSTVAFNIATTLASLNKDKKYLMIDLDMQGNLTNFFGIESYEKVNKDSSNMLLSELKPEEVVIKSPLKSHANVDLIPSSFNLFRNEIRLNNSTAKEYKLDRIINQNKQFFSNYNYIIIDTNPSLSVYNLNAFYVTDVIINVLKNNCISSLKALEMGQGLWQGIKDDLNKTKLEETKILINMDNNASNGAKQFKEYIYSREDLKDIALKSTIRNSVVFVDSVLDNKSAYDYDKKHKGTKDILNVISELEKTKIFN
jgi:chromosome partitioning protein